MGEFEERIKKVRDWLYSKPLTMQAAACIDESVRQFKVAVKAAKEAFPKCEECKYWTAYHPERGNPRSCEIVIYGHSRVGCPFAIKWLEEWFGEK